jgi:putative ABC transport system substrate-binding protein
MSGIVAVPDGAGIHRGCLAVMLVLLWTLAGCGVQAPWAPHPPRVAKIGYLGGSSAAVVMPLLEAFRDGMRQRGYTEGRDFSMEAWLAEGQPDRLPGLADALIAARPDLILVSGDQAIREVKAKTRSIPVVLVSCDAVAAGIVDSLARPGGNITGTTCISAIVSAKRVELLKEAVPGLARVTLLWNAGDRGKEVEANDTEASARALGLEVLSLRVRGPDDFSTAFRAVPAGGSEGLVVLGEALTLAHRKTITDFAASRRMPTMYTFSEFVEADGLMAYGTSLPGRFRYVAGYADKILRGAKPAELPVEQPTEFDFVINLRTAQALGLSIPQSILQQATGVIQ